MRSTSSRKLGSRRLRGCGMATLISLRMRPGLLPNTRMRSHISTASSMLWVTRITPLIGIRPSRPQIQEIGAQRLRGQHVERRERLVHEQDIRMHDQRAREAHPLAHAAGQLARIGRLEAVQTDQVDGRERTLADLGCAAGCCASSPSATFSNTVSQGNSAKLWNTMAMPARRTGDRLAQIGRLPALGSREPGDQPQQRRFARARAAEQAHDLPLVQRQVHALEHQQVRRRRASEMPCARRCTASSGAVAHSRARLRSAGICARRSNTAAARTAG